MNLIAYLVHAYIYSLLAFLCAAPALPLLNRADRLPAIVMAPLTVLVLVYLVAALWVSQRAAYRRVYGGEGFFEAILGAIDDLRLKTSLVLLTLSRPFRETRPENDPEAEEPGPRFHDS